MKNVFCRLRRDILTGITQGEKHEKFTKTWGDKAAEDEDMWPQPHILVLHKTKTMEDSDRDRIPLSLCENVRTQ